MTLVDILFRDYLLPGRLSYIKEHKN
uniref:Uncharacterized protein n=1 Tax=Rhizophora mucronata TaxID=61149 RepID=A0A2P2IXD1_RHIMU